MEGHTGGWTERWAMSHCSSSMVHRTFAKQLLVIHDNNSVPPTLHQNTGQVAMAPALLCLIMSCLYLGATRTVFIVFYVIEIYVLIIQVHHVVSSGDT